MWSWRGRPRDLLRSIGRRLGMSVWMSAEGTPAHPDLGYDADADCVVVWAGAPALTARREALQDVAEGGEREQNVST
ncbi:hypothetical protein GCM10027203_75040 [Nonomuraea fastidiosa]